MDCGELILCISCFHSASVHHQQLQGECDGELCIKNVPSLNYDQLECVCLLKAVVLNSIRPIAGVSCVELNIIIEPRK